MAFDFGIFKADNNSSVPIYCQIKDFLYTNIQNGNISPYDRFPPELELVEIFGVSRSTVRQAIDRLVKKNVLYRCKGKGTFIKSEKIEATFFQTLNTFNDEMQLKGKKSTTKQLSFEIIDPVPHINAALGIPANEWLIYLERVRSIDNHPNVYMESYLPFSIFRGFENENMENRSMYDVMEKRYNMRVNRVLRHIEIDAASKTAAEHLKILPGAPVFLVTFTGYANNDIPVEYSVSRYRSDVNKFVVNLSR